MARYATLQHITDPHVDQVRVGGKLFAVGSEVEVTEEEQERLKGLTGYTFTFRSDRKRSGSDEDRDND